jgi:hypothetical protein
MLNKIPLETATPVKIGSNLPSGEDFLLLFI